MDIYSPPGTKVVFAHPNAGYHFDIENARMYLDEESIYTVERTEVGPSYTRVHLREIPHRAFNSVQFEALERASAEAGEVGK